MKKERRDGSHSYSLQQRSNARGGAGKADDASLSDGKKKKRGKRREGAPVQKHQKEAAEGLSCSDV